MTEKKSPLTPDNPSSGDGNTRTADLTWKPPSSSTDFGERISEGNIVVNTLPAPPPLPKKESE